MRLECPDCGSRDIQEFTCLGEAGLQRPEGMDAEPAAMFAYAYLRDNPRGRHHELWFHGAGCQGWLTVARDTLTHAVQGVSRARDRKAMAVDGEAAE